MKIPYQVNVVTEAGFDINNLIAEQTSHSVEFESTYYVTDSFTLHLSFGFMDVDVQEQDRVKPVAPLTPEWTASIVNWHQYGASLFALNGATILAANGTTPFAP